MTVLWSMFDAVEAALCLLDEEAKEVAELIENISAIIPTAMSIINENSCRLSSSTTKTDMPSPAVAQAWSNKVRAEEAPAAVSEAEKSVLGIGTGQFSKALPLYFEQFAKEWQGLTAQDNFDGFRLEAGKAIKEEPSGVSLTYPRH